MPTDGSTNLFADGTSSYVISPSSTLLSSRLQERVDSFNNWFQTRRLSINASKSAVMVFSSLKMAQVALCVRVNSVPIPQVESRKHLGLTFNERLSWSNHVDSILKKASIRLGLLRRIRHVSSPTIAREPYCYCVLPILEYSNRVWSRLTKADAERLERCNRAAARLISNIRPEGAVSHQLTLA